MERREAFKRWLQNEKSNKFDKYISKNTIKSYTKGIHKISEVMYEAEIIDKRLYSINNIDEVQVAVEQIRQDDMYLNLNKISENMYHKALNYYTSFIESKGNN